MCVLSCGHIRENESIAWLSSHRDWGHPRREKQGKHWPMSWRHFVSELIKSFKRPWKMLGRFVLWVFMDFHFMDHMDVFPLTGTWPSPAQDMTKFSETKSQEVADGSWNFEPGKLIKLMKLELLKSLFVKTWRQKQWSVYDQFMISYIIYNDFNMFKVTRVWDLQRLQGKANLADQRDQLNRAMAEAAKEAIRERCWSLKIWGLKFDPKWMWVKMEDLGDHRY